MGSKAPEEPSNTETEEGTIALLKKRSRRVSFAEITSVHVFDRDEEFETLPDQKPSSGDSENPELGQSSDGIGFLRELFDGDYSKESPQNGDEDEDDDEDDELDARRSFLRPIESPSPGSRFGSATSNDEENFFGPVSTDFIRPGRLSDSGASDENHDLTMDSTAFSMHFRSLAMSESGGDLKTPTGVHLSFEEKTPTHDTSSMVLTVAKKPISQSYIPVEKLSGGSDSNDMSLVGENPRKYDYGKLSPGLDALLVGSKDLRTVSNSDNISVSRSPINTESKFSPLRRRISDPIGVNDGTDKEIGRIDTHDDPAEMDFFDADNKLEANDGSKSIRQSTHAVYPNTAKGLASTAPVHHQNVSPQLKKGKWLGKNKESVKDVFEMRGADLDFSTVDVSSPSNQDKVLRLDTYARNDYESSVAGPISSAKERQIYVDPASPSKFSGIVTPSEKQSVSFVRDENRNHGDSLSSIQRSISKLKMLEASPFSSTFKANIDSELKALDNIFKNPHFDILRERNSKEAQVKHVDASVAYFEDKLSSVNQTNGERKDSINMYGSDQPIKLVTPESSSSKFALLRNKTQQDLLTSEDLIRRTSVTSGTVSSLIEVRDDSIKDQSTPRSFIPSPVRRPEKKSLTSPEYKGSLSRELRLHEHNKRLKYSPGQYGDSIRIVTKAKGTDKLDFLFMEREESSSSFLELNLTREFVKDGREYELHDPQDEPGAIGNFETPLAYKDIQKYPSKVHNMKLLTGTDPARLKKGLPERGIDASSAGSDSQFNRRTAIERPFHKNLVEIFAQSPSSKELHEATNSDKMHSLALEDAPSPNSYQLKNGSEKSSARKRIREVTPAERDGLDDIARNLRSPKLLKGRNCDLEFLLEHPSQSDNYMCSTGLDKELKRWADVFEKFSGDTKQLLSPISDKLNLQRICALEDFMVHLQRLKMYQMLCVDIQSQKTVAHSNPMDRRVVETRLLLHKIVHEQTKLQLLCLKREKLLKKVEQVRSGIQESQSLKSNSLPRLSKLCARDTYIDYSHPQSFPVDFRVPDKVTASRKELEDSDGKIANLTKSFHTYCKMKGEPSCAETMTLVNNHLKKRTCHRFLRLELQLWEVDNLENRDSHHTIFLSYVGFITQRFTITVGPVSSIVISNEFNAVKIMKNFPNMDACIAFAFVLNADTTQKYVGPRSLTQETQKTSLLLGNLLDLVEEVQLAQIELENLVQTSFHSPSAQQLYLLLCFIDFKSGRKVKLTLDISCLNRGVYPVDIIPSLLEAPPDALQESLAQPLLAEIRDAVQSLKVGYLRIIRLCRCVSPVVQARSE